MRMPKKIFILPSAFTSGNLLCGFFSVVSAMRNDLDLACWLILVAALLDFIDGKVALFSRTESRFGIELDSLADLVSFGIAPGIIMYQFFLAAHGDWSWLVSFLFVLSAALRLARFNVETKGANKTKFKGLPTPMAGITVISFVPFSNTEIFQQLLCDIHYNRFLVFMMLGLAGLMVSNVEYPAVPRFKLLTIKGILGFVAFLATGLFLVYNWELLLFPASFVYIIWGFSKALFLGAVSRMPEKNS